MSHEFSNRKIFIKAIRFPNNYFYWIPVGAYEPRSFLRPQHVDPGEAVQIHLDVKSKASVGIHWGTFTLAHEVSDLITVSVQHLIFREMTALFRSTEEIKGGVEKS